jgi:hypothetical protein
MLIPKSTYKVTLAIDNCRVEGDETYCTTDVLTELLAEEMNVDGMGTSTFAPKRDLHT